MNELRFVWDESKNISNQKKHNVSFEEAKSAFYDENARIIDDPDHSQVEERFIILGLNNSLRLLVVVHTYRESNEVLRIISARKLQKMRVSIIKKVKNMKDEYNFSNSKKNPYVKKLKKPVTIRLDNSTIEYFKNLAEETDIPYQKLINLFLRDCANQQKRPSINWM